MQHRLTNLDIAYIPKNATSLDLRWNALHTKTIQELIYFIHSLPADITLLDLRHNQLGKKSVAELVKLLQAIPSSVDIHLSWHDFSNIIQPELLIVLNSRSVIWEMNELTRQEVMQLLDQRYALVSHVTEEPYNYATVKECILQIELKQEIDKLRSMIHNLQTFEINFMEHCAKRESDIERSIPFHIKPESLTNQLYWEIAQKVFQPRTMKDMLGIILPSIEMHLKADLNYLPKKIKGSDIQVMCAQPTLELLDKLEKFEELEPMMGELPHYVLFNKILFDVQEIAFFHLTCRSG